MTVVLIVLVALFYAYIAIVGWSLCAIAKRADHNLAALTAAGAAEPSPPFSGSAATPLDA